MDNYELLLLSKGLKIFDGFSIEEKMEILLMGRIKHFYMHDLVISDADRNGNFYLILEGSVSVWRKDISVTFLERGDIFNELQLFIPGKHKIMVMAETSCLVLQMERIKLLNHFEEKPERLIKKFTLNIIAILFNKIKKYEEEIVNAYLNLKQETV